MVTVKYIGCLDYLIVFRGLRTPLSDFYVNTQSADNRILGAYNEKKEGVGILIFGIEGEQAEILYIGANPKRQGTASELLHFFLDSMKEVGIKSVLWRICQSNSSFQEMEALAQKCDFHIKDTVKIFRSYKEDYSGWTEYMERHGDRIDRYLREEGFRPVSFAEASEEAIAEILDVSGDTFDDSLDPSRIICGQKGKFCREISYMSLKDGHPVAYCLVTQPGTEQYVFEIISTAKKYQKTGVIFQPFAMSVNEVGNYPYRQVGFAIYQKNKNALALSERVMKALISSIDLQYNYVYSIKKTVNQEVNS